MRTVSLATALLVSAVASTLGAGARPALAASASACEITDLACWGAGTKCNIKFKNNTGDASGGGISHQKSLAATIRVLAIKTDGTRAGSNTLTILDKASGTLNLDKKADFSDVEVYVSSGQFPGRMKIPCGEVRQILTADKACKIFVVEHNHDGQLFAYLAYNCGVVKGQSDNEFEALGISDG